MRNTTHQHGKKKTFTTWKQIGAFSQGGGGHNADVYMGLQHIRRWKTTRNV